MAALTVQSSGILPEYSKEKLPVICNVITDKELDNSKKHIYSFEEISLVKVLKLLTDKHSKHLVDRHYRAVKRLCSCYKHGIHLQDVKLIVEILKRCYSYIHIDSCYEELVCMLLFLFQKPFFKSKVSDTGTFLQAVSNSLSELGHLAETSSDNLKCATSRSISILYTSSPTPIQSYTDIQPVSSEFIRKATGLSTICKSIAECFGQVSDSDRKYIVLNALSNLSDSNITCDDILNAGAAASICTSLSSLVKNYKLLFVAVETLWNLLEHGSTDQIAKQLSCNQCLRSLKSTFIQKINNSNSHADRQLRNDIFVLITHVISKCPNAPLVDSGLTKMIAGYTSYPELPTRDETMCYVKFTNQAEDFELKKLFISAINILCVGPVSRSTLQLVSQCQVMLALFSYVRPIKQPLDSFWSVAEFEELQLQAMSVLAVLSPLCVEDYMKFQGNTRLLSMLDWCINFEDFGGHGNSFHGAGGRGSKRAQMRYCIRLLRCMCATGNTAVSQDLTDQGIIAQLVAILTSCSSSSDSNDRVDIELQCDMLFILASLCEGDIHRKELFGEAGVKMLLQYLNGYLKVKNGPLHHHKMVLSTTDCIWSCVIGCYLNEIHFLEQEGAFMLLDLLEICPEKMKNVVLGTLVDLTENKNTLVHVNLWRGKGQKTVGKLLVELWKTEEQRLGVKRDNNGVITDATRPLKTIHQEEDQYSVVLPYSYPSAAVVDVSDNLRSKLYGMFSRLGFNNVPGLLPADYVTLTIIEKYLDFKALEIWQEIKEELEAEKIEPVSPDKECMDAIISFIQEKASDISKMQQSLINNNLEQEILDEQEFYDKIKESHQQEEKRYQDFVHFVDRTSDINILKETRKEQLKMIEKSRLISRAPPQLQDTLIMHNTMDTTLSTTSLCGRNVAVKSTILSDTVSEDQMEQLKSCCSSRKIELEH